MYAIRSYYVRQAALEDVVRASWKKAVEQEALKPIAEPHVHNLKWEASYNFV